MLIGALFSGLLSFGGWGWGLSWLTHALFLNNLFFGHFGFGGFGGGGGFGAQSAWVHNPKSPAGRRISESHGGEPFFYGALQYRTIICRQGIWWKARCDREDCRAPEVYLHTSSSAAGHRARPYESNNRGSVAPSRYKLEYWRAVL